LGATSKSMRRQTFAIVGLGLLGGSLAGALRKKFPGAHVTGISRSALKLRDAQRKKIITAGTRDLKAGVQSADFIFICTPVDTIPKFISQIDRHAKPGAIVTDVGSTKGSLIRWVEKKRFKNIQFVGSHPMAGSHLTGLEHANSNLYQDSFTFVTAHRKVSRKALRSITVFWRRLCRKVVVVPADQHDQIVAEISHLPHLLAALLVGSVSSKSLVFASSGFRDTTRVAQSDPRLWVPILLSNRKNMLKGLQKFLKLLNQIKSALSRSDEKYLSAFLASSARKRSQV